MDSGIKRVVLAAGGTGGHIMPAIAFGQWIHEHAPNTLVEYICGARKLEHDIYGAFGISPNVLVIEGSPLGVRGIRSLTRSFQMIRACFAAKKILRKTRADACAIFGGYASGPVVAAAKFVGLRYITHEQNASAGAMTKLSFKMKMPIASAWSICSPLKDGEFVPSVMPIRKFARMSKGEAIELLGLPIDLKDCEIVMVLTGSLGSIDVDSLILSNAEAPDRARKIFVIPTAGETEVKKVSDHCFTIPMRWDPSPFFALGDIFISRGGASTLAELYALDVPTVVIPWRKAARDHQMKNAVQFADDPRRKIWDQQDSDRSLFDVLDCMSAYVETKTDTRYEKMYNLRDYVCGELWDLMIQSSSIGDGRKG